ncbi:hypothetical protein Tco_0991669 [Tanacetum coccineum]|uniref:Uncharacterized protein n=1 Tax=Tanacetum coccineum TaxID=301880 RepID=A0ABQ5F055_9ASTR
MDSKVRESSVHGHVLDKLIPLSEVFLLLSDDVTGFLGVNSFDVGLKVGNHLLKDSELRVTDYCEHCLEKEKCHPRDRRVCVGDEVEQSDRRCGEGLFVSMFFVFGLDSWINGGGWMFRCLVLRYPWVTSLSFSTTGGGIGGPSYETPLRVVIALASFLGFGMVLLGKELELEGWLL